MSLAARRRKRPHPSYHQATAFTRLVTPFSRRHSSTTAMRGVGLLRLLCFFRVAQALNCYVCQQSSQSQHSLQSSLPQTTFDFDTIVIGDKAASSADWTCRHQSLTECIHPDAVCRTLIRPNRAQQLIVIGKGCVVADNPAEVKSTCHFLPNRPMVECLCATDGCNGASVQAQIVDWMDRGKEEGKELAD